MTHCNENWRISALDLPIPIIKFNANIGGPMHQLGVVLYQRIKTADLQSHTALSMYGNIAFC